MYEKTRLVQKYISLLRVSMNYEKDYQILLEITALMSFKPRLDLTSKIFESYDNEIKILQLKNQLFDEIYTYYENLFN